MDPRPPAPSQDLNVVPVAPPVVVRTSGRPPLPPRPPRSSRPQRAKDVAGSSRAPPPVDVDIPMDPASRENVEVYGLSATMAFRGAFPPTYGGSRDQHVLNDWLSITRLILEDHNIRASEWVRLARMGLVKEARIWWNNIPTPEKELLTMSWEEFREGMLYEFVPLPEVSDPPPTPTSPPVTMSYSAARRFMMHAETFQVQDGETVQDCCDRFRRDIVGVSPFTISHSEQARLFWQAFPDEMRDFIVMEEVYDLNEMVEALIEAKFVMEEAQREREEERALDAQREREAQEEQERRRQKRPLPSASTRMAEPIAARTRARREASTSREPHRIRVVDGVQYLNGITQEEYRVSSSDPESDGIA